WIEKSGDPAELRVEAAVMRWCAGRLPVASVYQEEDGRLAVSALAGVNLTQVPMRDAVAAAVEALHLIHSLPAQDCPFSAAWHERVRQARERVDAGQVDESEFDEDNLGRTSREILAELHAMPAPPSLVCFTHGDACLPNFLMHEGRLTGIVDLGRAGLAHP